MSKHNYQCDVCKYAFQADDSYEAKTNNDPRLRNCPKCKKAKGQIMYHGLIAWVQPAINDKLWDVKNPVNGKVYDSKTSYYKAVKDSGSHIVEAGEKKPQSKEVKGDFNVRKELTQAVYRHFN